MEGRSSITNNARERILDHAHINHPLSSHDAFTKKVLDISKTREAAEKIADASPVGIESDLDPGMIKESGVSMEGNHRKAAPEQTLNSVLISRIGTGFNEGNRAVEIIREERVPE